MNRRAFRTAMLGVGGLALAAGLVTMSLQGAAAQEQFTIDSGDFWFGDPSFESGTYQTTIEAGDTVTWDFGGSAAPHTTTSVDGVWDSGTLSGGTFAFTFDEPGTYAYHCDIHPTLMMGVVTVEAAGEEPTEPPADDGTPPTDATPQVSGAPSAGQGYRSASGVSAWWIAASALGAVGIALSTAATLMYRRGR
jgi:plastocyanin